MLLHHFFVGEPDKMSEIVVEEVFEEDEAEDLQEGDGDDVTPWEEGEEEIQKTVVLHTGEDAVEDQEGEQALQLSTFCRIQPYILATPPNTLVRCKVVDVFDGDSCSINSFFPGPGLLQLRIRLRGITSLEIRSNSKLERQAAQVCRNALTAFITNKKIAGRKMRRPEIQGLLGASGQRDVAFECKGVDKYGRVLAELYRGKECATAWLLKQNLVRPYTKGRQARLPDALFQQIVSNGAAGVYDEALPQTEEDSDVTQERLLEEGLEKKKKKKNEKCSRRVPRRTGNSKQRGKRGVKSAVAV